LEHDGPPRVDDTPGYAFTDCEDSIPNNMPGEAVGYAVPEGLSVFFDEEDAPNRSPE
jgi:hypothetical protein